MKLTGRALGTSLTGSALAASALLAAGCTPSGTGTAAQARSSTQPTVASPASSAPAASASLSSAPAEGTATPSVAVATGNPVVAGAPATAPGRCTRLRITLRDGGAYNADRYTLIDFTNETTASCTLRGTPALDLVSATGVPMPTYFAANRYAPPARSVTLVPGGTAYARLASVINVAKGYPAAQCKPETSATIAVEPGSLSPTLLPFKVTVCTTSYVDVLSLAPFAPGAGPYVWG